MSKIFNKFINIGLFLITGLSLHGANLEDIALRILTGSRGYQLENLTLESEARSLATTSNLPDPEIGGEYLILPKDVDNRWTAEISWNVEWPGVYKARGKESNLKMTANEKALFNRRMERLAEIKNLLLDLIQCRQKLLLLEELTQNNDTIYRLAEQAAKGGELTVLDLNKVKLEYANIRVARAALRDEEREMVAELSQIYGEDCVELLKNLQPSFPEIYLPGEMDMQAIKLKAPSVQTALAEAEVARQGRNVVRMEALPSLSLGYKHAFEDGMHFNGVTWGISLPIFSSRGKQKAAKAEIMAAEYNVETTEAEVETDLLSLCRRLRLFNDQIKEITPIIENADYNSALLKAYQGGIITLIEYISDRNYFTNAAVELVSLRYSAAKTQVLLQKYMSLEL